MVEAPGNRFAVFVGHVENGAKQPFEVWVNGEQTPRGLAALAKNLSMDMRAQDRAWLGLKLESLEKTPGAPFTVAMPPDGLSVPVAGAVSAFAKVVRYRCAALGVFDGPEGRRRWSTRCSRARSRSRGWTGRCRGPSTSSTRRPATTSRCSSRSACCPTARSGRSRYGCRGAYPIELNGLTKSLSLDMRVIDPAWIGKKLRGLKDLPEAPGRLLRAGSRLGEAGGAALDDRLRGAAADPSLRDARGARPRRLSAAGSTVLWTDAPAPGAAPVVQAGPARNAATRR